MPIMVRTRNGGKSFELRVTHKALIAPVYRTFDSQLEAEGAGARGLIALDRGEIPEWLQQQKQRSVATIAQAINQYLVACAVPLSTEKLLETVCREVGRVDLKEVSDDWAEKWIKSMKTDRRIAPGTIRKKKWSLEAVFDWVVKRHPLCLGANPLRELPEVIRAITEIFAKR